MNIRELNAMFKSQLHARMINYDLFGFDSGSICVIIKVRSTSLSIQLPYIIEDHGNDVIVSSPQRAWKFPVEQIQKAVQAVVKDVRKQEVKFNKFSQ